MIALILRMASIETPMRAQIARRLEAEIDSLWFRHFDTPSVALNWEGFMVKHNRLLHKERDQQVFVVEQIGLDKL
ncbi:hypothetical protein [Burkholderia lata]|uniref:Uncharacterized protein n=1 Tax=Burkholderia lata (strain ATCC 17760 / DSM 23089 / LMG 22485 / NCIMB 9086 / R18194 / 383) TaxID=482957 RepID=A0A6P2I7D1_BURL3|nr:hypothetical protein [Burkholderia lata]VWB26701.1 hypothetical protein BLA14095_00991 [Burkholderia lata]VWB47859.1 hypothetical protein BLA15945_02209 [Burkholderia lata]VWC43084.1 hypothetical protein BLA15816_07228 [Burkholderia lata]